MGRIAEIRLWLRGFAPFVALFVAVIASVIPIDLGVFGFPVPMPLLPLIVVFLYAVYDPEALPTPAVFGLGLLHDVLYGGAFGVWASVYLAVQYLVLTQRDYFRGRLPHVIWLAFILAMIIVAPLFWAERSLIAGRMLAPWSMMIQFGVTAAAYPLVSRLFFVLRDHDAAERLTI